MLPTSCRPDCATDDRVRVKLAGRPASRSPSELKLNEPASRCPASVEKASCARLVARRIVCVLSRLNQVIWLLSCTVALLDDECSGFPPNDSDRTADPPPGSAEVTRTTPSGSC